MTQSQRATVQFWRTEKRKAHKAFIENRTELNKRMYNHANEKLNEAVFNYQEEEVVS